MTQRQNTYTAMIIVATASAASLYVARHQEVLQIFLAIPFAGSLLGVLVQVLRDQAAYEHSLLLQESGNRFALAVSSHMGNVAFDRHVEFSVNAD